MGAIDVASLPSLFSELPPSSQPALLNLLHHLHSSLLSARQSQSSLQSTHAALQCSHAHLHAQYGELHEAHSQLDKKLWETEMRRRQEETEHASREKALRVQAAEVERRAVMVQHRDKQYRHELRKRELEHDKLAERVLKLIQDKGGRDKAASERDCINDNKAAAERAKTRRDADVTARLLQREEEKRADAQQETAAIKAYLLTLEAHLTSLLPTPPEELVDADYASPSKRRPEQKLMELPWRMAERGVHLRLSQKLQALARHPSPSASDADTAHCPTSAPAPCGACAQRRGEAEALQRRLEEQQTVAAAQEALLSSRLFAAAHPGPLSPATRRLSLDEDLAELLDAHRRAQRELERRRGEVRAEEAEWEERRRRADGERVRWEAADALLTPITTRRGLHIDCSPSPSPPTSPFDWEEAQDSEGGDNELAEEPSKLSKGTELWWNEEGTAEAAANADHSGR